MKKLILIIAIGLFQYSVQSQAANCGSIGDRDMDGICDDIDNCPDTFQTDFSDDDNDGIGNTCDNCPAMANVDQVDIDQDGIGDACDKCIDPDKDGVCGSNDKCPGFDDKIDVDNDGIPDACDDCVDADKDGICDDEDDCVSTIAGSPCDDGSACTTDDQYDIRCNCIGTLIDSDKDGVCDTEDKCPGSDDNRDFDNDGIPDGCDEDPSCTSCTPDERGIITICHFSANGGLLTARAACNQLAAYFDSNGNFKNSKDHCGPCTCADAGDVDTDGDGVCDKKDACPTNPNITVDASCGCDAVDTDGDGVCDRDDRCPGSDDRSDFDKDGIPDGCDDLNYCIPDYDNTLEWISSISINNREYRNGQNDEFTFHNQDPINLEQGQVYSLKIEPEYVDDIKELSVAVYVDKNDNGSFGERGEEIISTRLLGTLEQELFVDSWSVGEHRMRVMVHYGRITDACQACIDGEVEDILINVVSPQPCSMIDEYFNYETGITLNGADGPKGWSGPWTLTNGTDRDLSILRNSLMADPGNKLGILSLPQSITAFGREVDLTSAGNEEIYVSLYFQKMIGTAELRFSIGQVHFGMNESGEIYLEGQGNIKAVGDGVHELILKIERNNSGEEGISLWIYPVDFDDSNPADLVAEIELSEPLSSIEVTVTNDNNFLPTVYYVDDIMISCNAMLTGAREANEKKGFALRPIKNTIQDIDIRVSPNPVLGERVHVLIQDQSAGIYPYHLISFDGKIVSEGVLLSGSNQIEATNLRSGLYTVIVQTDTEIKTITMVKQ